MGFYPAHLVRIFRSGEESHRLKTNRRIDVFSELLLHIVVETIFVVVANVSGVLKSTSPISTRDTDKEVAARSEDSVALLDDMELVGKVLKDVVRDDHTDRIVGPWPGLVKVGDNVGILEVN